MSTLLLRLAGPMQSWGTRSRFIDRDTEREPSKSGAVGLVCAALGKPRDEQPGRPPQLDELAALEMGVRVDREGVLLVDYQTAGGGTWLGQPYGVAKADGKKAQPVVSRRYYLSDAAFLVGLSGSSDLLKRLEAALKAPVWQMYLGRKSYLPGAPVHLPEAGPESVWWDMPLRQALEGYPIDGQRWHQGRQPLRLVLESEHRPGSEPRRDVPLDFAGRQFGLRYVTTSFMDPAGAGRVSA